MAVASLLWLVPAAPLASCLVLLASAGRMAPRAASLIACTGVAVAGVVTGWAGLVLAGAPPESAVLSQSLGTWIDVGGFRPDFGLRLDGLALVMCGVVTGVGFLIHVYAAGYLEGEADVPRFFAYMTLFVAAMLVLVLADDLLLLYLGWEGVGLCSYLLIGFHHDDAASGYAARKAFVVTRVGDTALALGLFLLFREFGTLAIPELLAAAPARFDAGDPVVTAAALLLLGGAVGKSAQVPLHTWLPDAMAGPTPVSALIHAATMVTAGVYLVARLGELFLLAPVALAAVAAVGLVSLLIAAVSATVQTDLKRLLAYSTMSQIGYMFLALGVGAWSAAIFHLVTHAFFKALLFLAAGAVIVALRGERDVTRMGGLRRALPLPFAGTLIGAAALAALPLTSGFHSKDRILLAAFEAPGTGPLLWAGAALAALITALYSTRLVLVVFFGERRTEAHTPRRRLMDGPIGVLALLALVGGAVPMTALAPVLPDGGLAETAHGGAVAIASLAAPILGVALGGWIWGRAGAGDPGASDAAPARWWRAGWGFDALYRGLLERPWAAVARGLRGEPLDVPFDGLAAAVRALHARLILTQTGQLRFYAGGMALGLAVLALALVVAS